MKTLFPTLMLLILLLPTGAMAFGAGDHGTTSAGFLKFGIGARAVSMGEAFSAVVDDASAIYWNPAALTRIEKRSATFMHASGLGSSFFEYAAYGQNLGSYGSFGASLQYLEAGRIVETDDATGADVGIFTPYDLALSWGYAYRLRDLQSLEILNGFSLGLAVKFVRSKILNADQTAAVDLGLLTPAYLGGKLRLAAAAANMGGKLKFETELADLPLVFRFGGAYHIMESLTVAVDAAFPNDSNPHVGLGTEYLYPIKGNWTVAGRLGFNSRTIGEVSGFTGFSFGVGMAHGRLSMDYGILPFGSIGQVHRASVSAKF